MERHKQRVLPKLLSPTRSEHNAANLNSSGRHKDAGVVSVIGSGKLQQRETYPDDADEELIAWAEFVKSQTIQYKNAGHVSLPVLTRSGAKSAIWANRVVKGT